MNKRKWITGVALVGAVALLAGCGGGGGGPSAEQQALTSTKEAIGAAYEKNDDNENFSKEKEWGTIFGWNSKSAAKAVDDKKIKYTIHEIDVDVNSQIDEVVIRYNRKRIDDRQTKISLPEELEKDWHMAHVSEEIDDDVEDVVGSVVVTNIEEDDDPDYVTAGYWYRTGESGQFGAFATGEKEFDDPLSLCVGSLPTDNDCTAIIAKERPHLMPPTDEIDADYTGLAVGFFVGDTTDADGSTDTFTGDIKLTLNRTTVTGEIEKILYRSTSNKGPESLKFKDASLTNLESKAPGNIDFTPRPLNYFNDEWDEEGWDGYWNGRFYGKYDAEDQKKPTSVAGTFWGVNEDDDQFIGGAYGAD
ncbi:MAG: hypothetical protein OXB95_03265 [Rhodobacteraceae bacterium]|nr:hypothetical protein [Paracoccaceae bacterium]